MLGRLSPRTASKYNQSSAMATSTGALQLRRVVSSTEGHAFPGAARGTLPTNSDATSALRAAMHLRATKIRSTLGVALTSRALAELGGATLVRRFLFSLVTYRGRTSRLQRCLDRLHPADGTGSAKGSSQRFNKSSLQYCTTRTNKRLHTKARRGIDISGNVGSFGNNHASADLNSCIAHALPLPPSRSRLCRS